MFEGATFVLGQLLPECIAGRLQQPARIPRIHELAIGLRRTMCRHHIRQMLETRMPQDAHKGEQRERQLLQMEGQVGLRGLVMLICFHRRGQRCRRFSSSA